MRIRSLIRTTCLLSILGMGTINVASAQVTRDPIIFSAPNESDEIIRLPTSGALKEDANTDALQTGDKLIPGGGLLLSFDTDKNGEISATELETGIKSAYTLADRNQDGRITPLEQLSWAEELPTYDSSLTNPVRFDPNLDRRVSAEEFSNVIMQLAVSLANTPSGTIMVKDLLAEGAGPSVDTTDGPGPSGKRDATPATPEPASAN